MSLSRNSERRVFLGSSVGGSVGSELVDTGVCLPPWIGANLAAALRRREAVAEEIQQLEAAHTGHMDTLVTRVGTLKRDIKELHRDIKLIKEIVNMKL